MVLNKDKLEKNPVNNFYYDLVKSGVLSEKTDVLIEPNDRELKEFKNTEYVLIQEGIVDYNIRNVNATELITLSPALYDYFKDLPYLEKHVLPFISHKEFVNRNEKREDVLYYHGRIIPGKVPIEDLEILNEANIKIVLRGPICKKYWIDENLEGEEYESYKKRLSKLKNVEIRLSTNNKKIIIDELNRYKFYFTLSRGEAFNVALEEAISCGAVPIVFDNTAYWWAHRLYVSARDSYEMINIYNYFIDNDELRLKFSNQISSDIKKRMSAKNIKRRYKASFWNKAFINAEDLDFEIIELVNNYSNYVETSKSCSGHYDFLTSFIGWNKLNLPINKTINEIINKRNFNFSWHLINVRSKYTMLTVNYDEYFYFRNKKYSFDIRNLSTIFKIEIYNSLIDDFKKLLI